MKIGYFLVRFNKYSAKLIIYDSRFCDIAIAWSCLDN